MSKKRKSHRSLVVYKSYSFVDKDPVIDQLRTIVADEGESYGRIHDMSGVSTSTLYNWFNGETRRPQFCSVMAVARSLGYDMQLTKIGASGGRRVARFKKRRTDDAAAVIQ